MHHNWLFWTAFHLCIISFICIIINSFDYMPIHFTVEVYALHVIVPVVMKQSNVYIPHTTSVCVCTCAIIRTIIAIARQWHLVKKNK